MTSSSVLLEPHEEHYHLVVLDPTHTKILAARPAKSWLLPYLRFRAHSRQTPVLKPYLERLGVDVTPIHEALLDNGFQTVGVDPAVNGTRRADDDGLVRTMGSDGVAVMAVGAVPGPGPGHTIPVHLPPTPARSTGRYGMSGSSAGTAHATGAATAHATYPQRRISQRYIALEAQDPTSQPEGLTWEPLEDLLSGRRAILPVQETALRTCVERFRNAAAPFDSPAQLQSAHHWVGQHLRAMNAEITGEATHHRMGRCDTVIGFPTTKGTIFFKGGERRMVQEALLTQALHALMPRHFPATLAFDRERHWWLTRGVAGTSLATAQVGDSAWLTAVRLLAETQRKTLNDTSRTVADLLATRRFGPAQHELVMARVLALLRDGPFRYEWPPERLAKLEDRLRHAGDRLMDHGLPWTWTPADFMGPNIFQESGCVFFTGIEDSYLAPPTLALSSLFYDLRYRMNTPQATLQRLMEAYVDAWRGEIDPDLVRAALADTALCGPVFTFRCQLDRHARYHGLWSSDACELPADRELHEEAQWLGTLMVPQARASSAGRG